MRVLLDELREHQRDYPEFIHGPLCGRAASEIERLLSWVSDLQSGMYVNCVYCGHRYGPGETTPVSMADALKAHIAQCPQHPMSKLRTALLSSPCPLPVGGDVFVEECIDAGHCTCDNAEALKL